MKICSKGLQPIRMTFIFAGNSADAISMYHILNKVSMYDYAHNAIPDTYSGCPQFGYALIDEWRQAYNSVRMCDTQTGTSR